MSLFLSKKIYISCNSFVFSCIQISICRSNIVVKVSLFYCSKYDEELQTALAISNSLCKTASTEKTETQAKKPGKKKGG